MAFAAPADDPRVRRPVDVALLVVSSVAAIALAWMYRARNDVDLRVVAFVRQGVPGWLAASASVIFVAVGVYAAGLIVVLVVRGRDRLTIARDVALAALVAVGVTTLLSQIAGRQLPVVIPELGDELDYPSFPVARLAVAASIILAAAPYLSAPWRTFGVRLVAAMSISTIVLAYGTLTGVLGAGAVGIVASSAVHVLAGSGLGLPGSERIRADLAEIGVDTTTFEYVQARGSSAAVVRAHADGGDVLAKIYGRDAAEAALATRVWQAMWLRGGGPATGVNRRQLAQHESLMLLTAERRGCATPVLIGWGHTSSGDSVVAVEWPTGVQLPSLADDDVDDALLDDVWRALGVLHGSGITHGAIEPGGIVVHDGAASFVQLHAAGASTDAVSVRRDRAQTLVATATVVGDDRAVEAARRTIGDELLADALPMLQAAALSRGLRQDARATGLKVSRLREHAAATLGVSKPEVAALQRVSVGNALMTVLTVFAAYTLVTTLVDIGLDTISDQVADASWAWIATAFVIAQLTNVGEYISLAGVIGRPIPFGPTLMFRYALSFVSLAVPSDAGAIAMNVRYQQKLGVPAVAAVAQGPLLLLISKGFDVILLALTARTVGARIDTSDVDFGDAWQLVVVVVVVTVVATVVVLAVPQLRSRMLPHVKAGYSAVKGTLTDPDRLFRVLAGTLMQKVCFALALSSAVTAFGANLTFGEAIFVNTAVSLFVGLVPVPGGIGVAETALSAGLIMMGVPEEAAVATAITHRMITAYIPPVFGWWTSRWLTARDYL